MYKRGLDGSEPNMNFYEGGLDGSEPNMNAYKGGLDGSEPNVNIFTMPPLRFGERFEEAYEVILVLDDREHFASHGSVTFDYLGFFIYLSAMLSWLYPCYNESCGL